MLVNPFKIERGVFCWNQISSEWKNEQKYFLLFFLLMSSDRLPGKMVKNIYNFLWNWAKIEFVFNFLKVGTVVVGQRWSAWLAIMWLGFRILLSFFLSRLSREFLSIFHYWFLCVALVKTSLTWTEWTRPRHIKLCRQSSSRSNKIG